MGGWGRNGKLVRPIRRRAKARAAHHYRPRPRPSGSRPSSGRRPASPVDLRYRLAVAETSRPIDSDEAAATFAQPDGAFSQDGVDLTLIDWMLGLAPRARLEAAQAMVDLVWAGRGEISLPPPRRVDE